MSGREFLHSPGPTNIPSDVLAAAATPMTDFFGPKFRGMVEGLTERLKGVFRTTDGRVMYFTAVGHGAWESTLVNLLCPDDRALFVEGGWFASRWAEMAENLGYSIERVVGDWRRAPDPAMVEAALRADTAHRIKAVLVVHTETATGTRSDLAAMRAAIDAAEHPALYVVDAVASLAVESLDMDELGIDVVVGASQKGLMCPPGLALLAVSPRAIDVALSEKRRTSYWSWAPRLEEHGYFNFGGTPPETHLFALDVAVGRIEAEGLDAVVARHARLADAVRAAVQRWGVSGSMEIHATDPSERANAITCVRTDESIDVQRFRDLARDHYSVSISGALGPMAGQGFRIGHLGDLNEPMVLGMLGAVELAFRNTGVPHESGIADALDSLAA